jgi:hypothetical protein
VRMIAERTGRALQRSSTSPVPARATYGT